LSDLKFPYVEIVNPLLSNSLIELVRRLPDSLRTEKRLWRRIVDSLSPDIPFASSRATQSGDDVLQSRQAVEFMRDSLSGSAASSTVPPKLAAYVVDALTHARSNRPSPRKYLRRMIGARLPSWIIPKRTKVVRPPRLSAYRLAFRTFIVSRASRMLAEDAQCLR
jgi:hypothetical protein